MYTYSIHLCWDENGGTKRSDCWILMTCVSQAETWAIKKESTLEKLPVLIVLLYLFLEWPHLLSKVMHSHHYFFFLGSLMYRKIGSINMFLIWKWNFVAVCKQDLNYQKGIHVREAIQAAQLMRNLCKMLLVFHRFLSEKVLKQKATYF